MYCDCMSQHEYREMLLRVTDGSPLHASNQVSLLLTLCILHLKQIDGYNVYKYLQYMVYNVYKYIQYMMYNVYKYLQYMVYTV